MNKHYHISLLVSTIFAILYIVFADYYSFAWCDEIFFSNPAANYIHGRDWYTAGVGNLYPPLYSLLLTVWFYIFGVSHQAAVSLEVIITLAVYFKLSGIIKKRSVFDNPLSYFILIPMFWLGFYMPTIFTMGRVDMLVLLILLFLLDEILPHGNKLEISWWEIIILSALLSFSAIYPLPFMCFILLFAFFVRKNNRKQIVRGGIYMMLGFCIGLLFTLLFAYSNRFLAGFLAWILGMGYSGDASFTEKLLHAYCDIPSMILYCCAIVVLLIKKQTKIPISVLVFIIINPLLMTLAGRYERYYWWMTSLPIIMVFISSIETFPKKYLLITTSIVFVICIASQVYLVQYPHRYSHDYLLMDCSNNIRDYKQEQDLAIRIVNENKALIKDYKSVVFMSGCLYYPLLENTESCWYNFHDVHFAPHDRTKVYWRIYEDFIRAREERETIPNRGLLIALNDKQVKEGMQFLKKRDYAIKQFDVDNLKDAALIAFEK